MFALPPTLISPATVREAGGGKPANRNWETVAWIFWGPLGPLPVFVGTHPTALTVRSFGLSVGSWIGPLTVTNTTPICVPFSEIGIGALPSQGAGAVAGAAGRPFGSAGLLRAQIARSRPDSVIALAWATIFWF